MLVSRTVFLALGGWMDHRHSGESCASMLEVICGAVRKLLCESVCMRDEHLDFMLKSPQYRPHNCANRTIMCLHWQACPTWAYQKYLKLLPLFLSHPVSVVGDPVTATESLITALALGLVFAAVEKLCLLCIRKQARKVRPIDQDLGGFACPSRVLPFFATPEHAI